MHGTVECSGDPDWSLFSPVVCGLWLMLPVPALAVATVRLSHARPAKCQTETGAMSMSFQCCRCRGLIVPAEADTGAACRPSPLAHGFLQGSVLASSSYSTVQYVLAVRTLACSVNARLLTLLHPAPVLYICFCSSGRRHRGNAPQLASFALGIGIGKLYRFIDAPPWERPEERMRMRC
jgi:hypothetical protein